MSLRNYIIKAFINKKYAHIEYHKANALHSQDTIFKHLLKLGRKTHFGQQHYFNDIDTYNIFKSAVPIHDYEVLKPYIQQIQEGQKDVLWPGKPLYFAKTSGTTSGIKYIPITRESIAHHIDTARNALICYTMKSHNYEWINGKMIFLSGSPHLDKKKGIHYGRLSGIVNHHVPMYLKRHQLPSYKSNCIEQWESKLNAIIEETLSRKMTLISGIPPWIKMYFEQLIAKTKKATIKAIFPHFQILIHGGVNFSPYAPLITDLIGKPIDTIETFPASEGFIAFQDNIYEEGLLLNTNAGIFFEFIKVETIFDDNPQRYRLSEVELFVNYAIIINSNAGLWGYNIGDTIKFINLQPYKIIITGRIKHFISAFGEHVIAEEVEKALTQVCKEIPAKVSEFTVAPFIQGKGKSYHEWYIEFKQQPSNLMAFQKRLNDLICTYNIYYKDLIQGHILKPLVIIPIQQHGFIKYMKSINKLGGQHKLPRLTNNRQIVNDLMHLKLHLFSPP